MYHPWWARSDEGGKEGRKEAAGEEGCLYSAGLLELAVNGESEITDGWNDASERPEKRKCEAIDGQERGR